MFSLQCDNKCAGIKPRTDLRIAPFSWTGPSSHFGSALLEIHLAATPPNMHTFKIYSSAAGTIILALIAMPYLTTSAPTNSTSPIIKPVLAVSPINLAADQCPTPPTEYLPYPPPPGYQPGPGCAPASQGTQPSENNPPAGFYGGSGSGSGSGSSSQTTSPATSMRGRNPLARVLGRFLAHRKRRRAMALHFEGSTVSVVNVEEMDWMFNGMRVFGGAAEERTA